MNLPVDALRSSALTKSYAASFTSATGLPLLLHAPGDFEISETPGVPDYCRSMSLKRKACEQCIRIHLSLQDEAGTRSRECFAGLTSSAVPVSSEGRAIAYLHTGHALVESDGGSGAPGKGRKPDGIRGLRKLSVPQYEGAVRLLEIFSEQIGSTYSPGKPGTAYPAIDRAARLIRKNVEKTWRLSDLADDANMHPAYFSEMFHHYLGVTLTDFVAEARARKARQMLEFSNLRVIDIAFAAGFGSISQFNRVFRRIYGCSPVEFRRQLTGPTAGETMSV